jgi:hypothetical protein
LEDRRSAAGAVNMDGVGLLRDCAVYSDGGTVAATAVAFKYRAESLCVRDMRHLLLSLGECNNGGSVSAPLFTPPAGELTGEVINIV